MYFDQMQRIKLFLKINKKISAVWTSEKQKALFNHTMTGIGWQRFLIAVSGSC